MAFDGDSAIGKKINQLVNIKYAHVYSNTMPECGEKSLIKLYVHFYISEKLNPEDATEAPGYEPIPSARHALMVEQFKNEGLELDEALNNFENLTTNALLNQIEKLEPLNIPYINTLLNETEASSSNIKNRDTVVLIGQTGAGKSTLLRFLAGGEPTWGDDKGLPHCDIDISNLDKTQQEALKNATTSRAFHSETRNMHAVELIDDEGSLTICDAAGLNDTEGAEQDLCNGITLINGLNSARSKPVILFAKDDNTAQRGSTFIANLRKITKIIPNIEQHFGSITYIFTKYTQNEAIQIYKMLDEISVMDSVEKDKALSNLIKDIKTKIEHFKNKNAGKPELIDFKADKAFLDKQRKHLKESFSTINPIGNDEHAFQHFAAGDSQTKLLEQIKITQDAIRIGLKNAEKPGVLAIVSHKMQQIENLDKRLGGKFSEIRNANDKNIAIKKEHIGLIKVSLNEKQHLLMRTEDLNSAQEQAQVLKENLENIALLDHGSVNTTLDSLASHQKVLINNIKTPEVESSKAVIAFQRINVYHTLVQDLDDDAFKDKKQEISANMRAASDALKSRFNSYIQSATTAIKSFNLEKYLEQKNKAVEFSSILQEKQVAFKNAEEQITTLKNKLDTTTKQHINNAYEYLIPGSNTVFGAEHITKTIALCRAVSETRELELNYIPDISAIELSASEKINELLEKIKILSVSSESLAHNSREIITAIDDITQLRTADFIRSNTEALFQKLVATLNTALEKLDKNITNTWKKILDGAETDDKTINDTLTGRLNVLYELTLKYNFITGTYSQKFTAALDHIKNSLISKSNEDGLNKDGLNEDGLKEHKYYFLQMRITDLIKNLGTQDDCGNKQAIINEVKTVFNDTQEETLNELLLAANKANAQALAIIKAHAERAGLSQEYITLINEFNNYIKGKENVDTYTFDNRSKLISNLLKNLNTFLAQIRNHANIAYKDHSLDALPKLKYQLAVADNYKCLDVFMHANSTFKEIIAALCEMRAQHEELLQAQFEAFNETAPKLIDNNKVYAKKVRKELNLTIPRQDRDLNYIFLNIQILQNNIAHFFNSVTTLGVKEENKSRSDQVEATITFVENEIIKLIKLVAKENCEYILSDAVLDYINKTLINLPDTIKEKIQKELTILTETVNNRHSDELTALSNADDDIEKLTNLMNSRIDQYHFGFVAVVKNTIDAVAQKRIKLFREALPKALSSDKPETALNDFQTLYLQFKRYHELLRHLANYPESLKHEFTFFDEPAYADKAFNKSLASVVSDFEKKWGKDIATLQNTPDDHAFYALEHLNQFRKKIGDRSYNTLFALGSQLSIENLDKAITNINTYYKTRHLRLNQLLNEKQMTTEVNSILNDLKQYDALLTRLKALHKESDTIPDYAKTVKNISQQIRSWQEKLHQDIVKDNQLAVNELKSFASQSRDEYYKDIYKIYLALDGFVHATGNHFEESYKIVSSAKHGLDKLNKQLSEIYSKLPHLIETSFEDDENEKFNTVAVWLDNLRSCEEHFQHNDPQISCKKMINTTRSFIIKTINAKIQQPDIKAIESEDILAQSELVADYIVRLKHIALTIHINGHEQDDKPGTLKEEIDQLIDSYLATIEEQNSALIPVLCPKLKMYNKQHRQATARKLIQEHDVLAGFTTYLRNKATAWISTDTIISKLDGTNIDRTLLRKYYEQFQTRYWELVKIGLGETPIPPGKSKTPKNYLIDQAKAIPKLKLTLKDEREKVCDLLAHLFAIWTTQDPISYNKMKKLHQEEKFVKTLTDDEQAQLTDGRITIDKLLQRYLLQPHPAQVIALFRLLGIDAREHVLLRLLKGNLSISAALSELFDFTNAIDNLRNVTFEGIKQGVEDRAEKLAYNLVIKLGILELTDTEREAEEIAKHEQNKANRYQIDTLSNHLAQIKTGQGKSVTLAILACVLSLYGHRVDAGCYSQILASRDEEAFRELFTDLSISTITYNNFEYLAEQLIKDGGYFEGDDLRVAVQNAIRNNSIKPAGTAAIKKTLRQLLLDEVDRFFSRDFFGNTYDIYLALEDNSIPALTDFVWNLYLKNSQKITELKLDHIMESEEFKACQLAFPGYGPLITEAVKGMLYALKGLDNHEKNIDYQFNSTTNKIEYRVEDQYLDNKNHQYLTLFLMYKLNHNNPSVVPKNAIEQYKRVYLDCGKFSYAKLFTLYKHVRGVTGTLSSLQQEQKRILRNQYGISEFTYVPSAYPEATSRNAETRIANNQADHYKDIAISLSSKVSHDNRAGLVFFKNRSKLIHFYNSEQFSELRNSAAIIDETLEKESLDALISSTATTGRITLATWPFSRGTDFVCYDDALENRGGLHVISTIVPPSPEDEIQVNGRTRRQGGNGSVEYIIDQNELSSTYKMNIDGSAEYLDYNMINRARNKRVKDQATEAENFAAAIAEEHETSMALLQALKNGNNVEFKKLLIQRNSYPSTEVKPSRVVIMLDATYSMDGLIKNTKNAIGIMLRRLDAVLTKNDIKPEMVKLRVLAYRNYNASKVVSFNSEFTNDIDALTEYTKTLYLDGGSGGREAAEAGFYCINMWPETTHVICMGDNGAQGDFFASVRYCEHEIKFSESDTRVIPRTNTTKELKRLKQNKVRVDTFSIDCTLTNGSFDRISNETGGRSQTLNGVNQNAGVAAEKLTNAVCNAVLSSVGDEATSRILLQTYKEEYGNGGGYTASKSVSSTHTKTPYTRQSSQVSSSSTNNNLHTNYNAGGPSNA